MDLTEKLKELLKDRNVLLTGGGGVGKSYLTRELITSLRREGKQIVVLGSTGVSAVHVNGQTIHSFFAFGISNNLAEMKKNDKYNKARIKELYKILNNADLLIIDEISMVSTHLMDMILYRLKSGNFSGSVLFVGDFFQLPPVKSRNTQDNSLFAGAEYAFESSSWEYFDPYYVELTKTKRTEDENFFNILSRIRKGELDEEVSEYLNTLRENHHVREESPTILFGRNAEADAMNIKRLALIEAEPILLKAKEKVHYPTLHVKRIESWKKALPVPADLNLKIGATVLFCTNKWGMYYNGERGTVQKIDEESVEIEKFNGKVVSVKRQEYTLSENITLNGKIEEKPLVTLEQFPLKLAYAITIHKSQGMSIDSLVCNIDHIFEKSQFYVAISRAKNPDQLLIDYSYDRFESHLSKCIKVSQKVVEFYENSDIFRIEEVKPTTLF